MQTIGGATPLMYACQQGRESEVLDLIIKEPHSVKDRDRTLKTPLHYCAENSSTGCAEAVLRIAPELVNAQDENGYCALHLAVIAGNKPLIKLLIIKGTDINIQDNEGHSAVHWAIVSSEKEALEIIIRAGANASTPDIHGGYPLHYAVQMCGSHYDYCRYSADTIKVVQTLLFFGVDVSVKDKDGREPILWAASAGSAEAIVHLINGGASVEAADKDGLTALHCAASRGHTQAVETLVTVCGAHVDLIDGNGCSALFYAVTLGHADSTEVLLRLGAEPNRQDRKGRTPAHCGAAKGQMETLRILQKYGGNLWTRNVKGDLPLHEAVASGRIDLILWLLSQNPGAVNIVNNDGRSSLHIASMYNNMEMIKTLIEAKSLVNPVMRTSKGILMTPLNVALCKGHINCGKYLQLHGGVPFSKVSKADSNFLAVRISPSDEMMSKSGDASASSITPTYNKTSKNIHQDGQVVRLESGADKKKVYRRRKKRKNLSNENKMIDNSDSDDDIHDMKIRQQESHAPDGSKFELNKAETTNGNLESEKIKSVVTTQGGDRNVSTSNIEPGVVEEVALKKSVDSKSLHRNVSFSEHKNISNLSPDDFPPLMESINQLDKEMMESEIDVNKPPVENENIEREFELQSSGEVNATSISETKKKDEEKSAASSKPESSGDKKSSNGSREKVANMKVEAQDQKEKAKKASGKKRVGGSFQKDEKGMTGSKVSNAGNSSKKSEKSKNEGSKSTDSAKEDSPNNEKRPTECLNSELSVQKNEIEDGKTKPLDSVTEAAVAEKESKNDADKKNSNDEVPIQGNEKMEVKVSAEGSRKDDEITRSKSEESLEKKSSVLKSGEYSMNPADGETYSPEQDKISNHYLEIKSSNSDPVVETEKEDLQNFEDSNILVLKNEPGGVDVSKSSSGKVAAEEQVSRVEATTEKPSNVLETKLSDVKIEVSCQEDVDTTKAENVHDGHNSVSDVENMNPGGSVKVKSSENEILLVNSEGRPASGEKTSDDSVLVEGEKKNKIDLPVRSSGEEDEKKEKTSSSGDYEIHGRSAETPPEFVHSTTLSNLDESSLSQSKDIANEMKISDENSSQKEETIEGNIGGSVEESTSGGKPRHSESFRVLSSFGDTTENRSERNSQDNESAETKVPMETVEGAGSGSAPSFHEKEENGWMGVDDERRHFRTPRVARLCRRNRDFRDDNHISVTQLVQNTIRKYHMERGIFYQLLELKRMQIRSGKANEQVLVKRLADEYERTRVFLGMKHFSGLYRFRDFEKFLYDQLKILNSRNHLIIPEMKSYDDIDALSGVLKKSRFRILNDTPQGDAVCTCITQRCHHTAHAYTSVPCSAYVANVRRHRIHKPRRDCLLPRLDHLPGYQYGGEPATLELVHGSEKQVITLPGNYPDKGKRYYVTFTIKGAPSCKEENFIKHRHAKSV